MKKFMSPPIDKYMRIYDSEGTIKMAKNRFSGRWTRCVDNKHHNSRDTIEGG